MGLAYLPTLIPSKSPIHVGKYTVRPMDPVGYLEPETCIYKWLFQLDDSNSLNQRWLFHLTSLQKIWLFRVPSKFLSFLFGSRPFFLFHRHFNGSQIL